MGNSLFQAVVDATGLPNDPLNSELNKLLLQNGVSPDEMTLADLREAVAGYLQDILLEAKENFR